LVSNLDEKKERGGFYKVAKWLFFIVAGLTVTEFTIRPIRKSVEAVYTYLCPPKLEISLTKCAVYRTKLEPFPICELDIVVRNPSEKRISIELKRLTLFRENIMYHFPTGEIIRIDPNDKKVEPVSIKDTVLDAALQIPQEPTTMMLKLVYEYVNRNSKDSVVLRDKDVTKCTYWQRPVFETEEEALATGAIEFSVEDTIYWHRPSGVSGRSVLAETVFTNKDGLRDLDMEKSIKDLFSWKLEFPFVIHSAFYRKYGGIYFGCLAQDTSQYKLLCDAGQIPGPLSDYYKYTLIGTTQEQDFSNVCEFIDYSFDPARWNESFKLYQENSEYYIMLIYERDPPQPTVLDHLRKRGYRVGKHSTRTFGTFLEILISLLPPEKGSNLQAKLNACVDTLNLVFNQDGLLIFFPMGSDPKLQTRIVDDIVQATKRPYSWVFGFDFRPREFKLLTAPYSTPVLGFLNFSDETKMKTIDSLRIGSDSE
jgi:hypothetical protein